MWLIENRVFPPSEEARLLAALDDLGIAYERHSGSDLRSQPDAIARGDVARGSCWWISRLCGTGNWNREDWGAVDDFSFSAYAERFGSLLLNFPFAKVSFHELCWRGVGVLAGADSLFVRPDDGFKSFEGRIVAAGEFEQWVEATKLLQVRGSASLIVAAPRAIRAEWRCVIVDGRVVGSSRYRPTPSPETPRAVVEFAEAAHRTAGAPCRCYVTDVADTVDGFRVVEIGAVNCVAFYEADSRAIVRAFAKI